MQPCFKIASIHLDFGQKVPIFCCVEQHRLSFSCVQSHFVFICINAKLVYICLHLIFLQWEVLFMFMYSQIDGSISMYPTLCPYPLGLYLTYIPKLLAQYIIATLRLGDPNNALWLYPHVKVSIRDSSQILTTAPIFLYSNYFRQKYLEIASCAVSLLNKIWVRVEHSPLQQPNLKEFNCNSGIV